jgi:hypothetical protein
MFTKDLKSLSTMELVEAIKSASNYYGGEIVSRAVDLLLEISKDQLDRIDGPYVNHPLRVALRVIRFGHNNPNKVVATLFHDVLEDAAMKLAAKMYPTEMIYGGSLEAARHALCYYFNDEILYLVNCLTKPNLSDVLSRHDKNRFNLETLSEIFGLLDLDPPETRPAIIKLADFYDNSSDLESDIYPLDFKLRVCGKYSPIFPLFINIVRMRRVIIDDHEKVLADLVRSEDYGKKLLSIHGGDPGKPEEFWGA